MKDEVNVWEAVHQLSARHLLWAAEYSHTAAQIPRLWKMISRHAGSLSCEEATFGHLY